jgi:hypothetical protein
MITGFPEGGIHFGGSFRKADNLPGSEDCCTRAYFLQDYRSFMPGQKSETFQIGDHILDLVRS